MLFSAAEGKIGSSTTAILSQFLISNLKVVYAHTSGDVDSFKTNLLCILSLSLHAKFDWNLRPTFTVISVYIF